MMDSLSLAQIAAFAEGTFAAGDRDATVTRVSTDSRTLQSGDLFVPLRGENFDGHKFIQQAGERGAVGAIVEEKWNGNAPTNFALIRVAARKVYTVPSGGTRGRMAVRRLLESRVSCASRASVGEFSTACRAVTAWWRRVKVMGLKGWTGSVGMRRPGGSL